MTKKNTTVREEIQQAKIRYSQFHKTLPKSNLKMHWILVRFYEMGDI